MKLYTCSGAPSPERVTHYLGFKGIELERVEVDLRAGEHLSEGFAAKSPDCTVPVLELADGFCLWETDAIRRYLEVLYPQPPMFGQSPRERAEVDQWLGWVFAHGLLAVMEAFRNASKGFRNHALTGRRPVPQIPALAERGRDRYQSFLIDLDERLKSNSWIAGEGLSVVDVDAAVTLDFAERAIKIGPAEGMSALRDWRERFSAGTSGSAG